MAANQNPRRSPILLTALTIPGKEMDNVSMHVKVVTHLKLECTHDRTTSGITQQVMQFLKYICRVAVESNISLHFVSSFRYIHGIRRGLVVTKCDSQT